MVQDRDSHSVLRSFAYCMTFQVHFSYSYAAVNKISTDVKPVMLVLVLVLKDNYEVLVLVLKDSLRTIMKSLSWSLCSKPLSWSFNYESLSLSWSWSFNYESLSLSLRTP